MIWDQTGWLLGPVDALMLVESSDVSIGLAFYLILMDEVSSDERVENFSKIDYVVREHFQLDAPWCPLEAAFDIGNTPQSSQSNPAREFRFLLSLEQQLMLEELRLDVPDASHARTTKRL